MPIGALAALVVVLTACGGGDEAGTTTDTTTTTTTETMSPPPPPPPPPTTVRVKIRGGVPAGGVVRASVDRGDRVVLVVRSDVSDHVHVHGYDLFGDAAPGSPARIAFRATIPGRFEIELEDRHVPIAELTVRS